MSDDSSLRLVGDLFEDVVISPRLTASDKRQVLSAISEMAARSFGLKAPKVFEALMEREAQGPTGVGHGVAIPHARVEGLDRVRIVFARLATPMEFGSVDGGPVDLVLALISPIDSGSDHLRALARAARALRSAELQAQLRRAQGGDALKILLAGSRDRSAA